MKVFALTGGIAAGKSEVSRKFADAGIPVIDADRVAHEVMEPGGRAFAAVVAHFGNSILTDGRIDRGKLGAIVFDNPEALARLNAMVHPAVQLEIAKRLADASENAKAVVVEAALHAENGRIAEGMSGLILVQAPAGLRLKRLVENRGLDPEAARKRIEAQSPPDEKMRLATWVIENTGDLESLDRQVIAIAKELLK